MVKITRVEAFAGRDGPIQLDSSTINAFYEATEVGLTGDLGGGVGIKFDNGMTLLIGDEGAGIIEVQLQDADGEPMPVGRMSWSDTYHFEVPER